MKICVLTTCYPRFEGDFAGCFVKELWDTLLASKDFNAWIVTPHEQGAFKHEQHSNVTVHRFQYAWPASRQRVAYGGGIPANISSSMSAKIQCLPFAISFLHSAMKYARHADIIHANWVETALFGRLAAKRYRKPLITTVHSLVPLMKFKNLYKYILEGSDYVLFNSSYTWRIAEKMAPQVNGEVLFQGIHAKRFNVPRANAFRSKTNACNNDILIASIGRLVKWKGHVKLIQALREIDSSVHHRIHVMIAGDGPERARIETAVSEAGLENRVHLLGRVSTDQIPALLADCDIYVNPAIVDADGRTESMGVAVCEAMAAGLPCIVSDTGGLPDLVIPNETGLLVESGRTQELANAISYLFNKPNMRKAMGENGKKRAVSMFDWTAIARRTREIYESVHLACSNTQG